MVCGEGARVRVRLRVRGRVTVRGRVRVRGRGLISTYTYMQGKVVRHVV